MKYKITILPILLMIGAMIWAQDTRGLVLVVKDKQGAPTELPVYEKTAALIIGIDEYPGLSNNLQLKYAVSDAKGVESTLRANYQFDRIETLYGIQATRKNIYAKFSEFGKTLGENDALFVFFAGHGMTVGELGYILPVDGSFDEAEGLSSNISMNQLRDEFGKLIKAKHIFYCIDACYSGSIFVAHRGAELNETTAEYLKEITKEPVRYALTAGDKGQQVLDGGANGHSVFTGRFIEALTEAQDFVTAGAISNTIARKVFNDAKDRGATQSPQSGALSGQGQFVFIKKNGKNLASAEKELEETNKKIENIQKLLKAAQNKQEQDKISLQLQTEEAIRLKKEQEVRALEELEAKKQAAEEKQRLISRQMEEKKKAANQELERLKAAAAEQARLMSELGKLAFTPESVQQELDSTLDTIARITKELDTAKKNALTDSDNFYDVKINEANTMVKDEFEQRSEFIARRQTEIDTWERGKYDANQDISLRFDAQKTASLQPLKDKLGKMSNYIIVLQGQDVVVDLDAFDAENQQFPVRVSAPKYNVSHTFYLEVKANNSMERREKGNKIKQAHAANGYAGQIQLGVSPTNFGFDLLHVQVKDLTNNNSILLEQSFARWSLVSLAQKVEQFESAVAAHKSTNYDDLVRQSKELAAECARIPVSASKALETERDILSGRIDAGSASLAKSYVIRIRGLELRKTELQVKNNKIKKLHDTDVANTLVCLGIGLAAGGVAAFSYIDGVDAYTDYQSTFVTDEATKMRKRMETDTALLYSGIGLGSLFLITSLASIPPKIVMDTSRDLDQQISSIQSQIDELWKNEK